MRRPLISMNFFSPNGFAPRPIDILLERFSGLPGRRCISHDEYHVHRGIVLAIAVERRVASGASMEDGVGHAGERKSVVSGTGVSVRVGLGCGRVNKKKSN